MSPPDVPPPPLLHVLRIARDYIFQRHWRMDEKEEYAMAQHICELLSKEIIPLDPVDPVDSITAVEILGEIILHAKEKGRGMPTRPRTLVQSEAARREAIQAGEDAVKIWKAEEIEARNRRREKHGENSR